MNSRKRIVGAIALAATLCTGLVQARDRSDVQWSVSIGGPIGVSIGVPIYSQPYPVYSQPYPVYSQPYPVYAQPILAYPQRPYWPQHYRQPTRWDRDGDGIPNRYERNHRQPRNDRDGDGIPNWQDRHDGHRGR